MKEAIIHFYCLFDGSRFSDICTIQARRKRGTAGAAAPLPAPPTPQAKYKCLKEILFTLQILNEELNSFHSYKTHRFGLL